MTLDTARLRTIEQVKAFMLGTAAVGFGRLPESECYGWIGRTLNQFAYQGCVEFNAGCYGASLRV